MAAKLAVFKDIFTNNDLTFAVITGITAVPIVKIPVESEFARYQRVSGLIWRQIQNGRQIS